jgi:hypothetical protein
MLVIQPLR